MRRVLQYEAMFEAEQKEALECGQLLSAMELEEDELANHPMNMDVGGYTFKHYTEMSAEGWTQDDIEEITLLEEWVSDLQSKKKETQLGSESKMDLDTYTDLDTNASEQTPAKGTAEAESDHLETLPQSSQPTMEDLEKTGMDGKIPRGRKNSKKQQWGPVIPLRRSSMNIDNGRPVLEEA